MIASLAQETKTAIKATLDSETSLQAVCTTQSAGITAFLNTSVRIPDHLEIEGTWNGICVCGHPVSENIQDMVFKCVYRNGSYSLCTPTLSPEVWGDTEGEQTVVFFYEEGGVTITASKTANVVAVLISLSVSGTWTNVQITDTAPDLTGLVFTASFNNGEERVIAHSDLVVSPPVWTSTISTQTATFSYTYNDVTETTAKSADVLMAYPVGGILFYIDSSVEGSYQFLDPNGNRIDTPAIGTDCTGYFCAYVPMEKDKFYVSYNQLYTSKYWGGNGTLIGASGTAIGTGRSNTAKAIGSAADVTRSIWETIRNMRTNNLGGCDDWYVPARAEVDQYRTAVSDAWFTNHIWSSSELNATNGWYWMPRDRTWYGNPKNYDKCVFGIRSFGALALVSLSVSGEWENMQIKGDSVDFTGLVFTASFSDGSTQIVTPTVSPSVWSASGMQTAIFSYTYNGITKSVTSSVEVVDISIPVGGIIFYIDDTADGTYRFWDANGQEVEAPTVGTDCTGWTYRVEGATKDKFYVVHDELYAPNAVWTYYKDGAFVLEVVGASGAVIGTGKSNTAIVMSKDDGAYITDNSNGKPTMWYLIQQMRTNLVGGCDDWYVPSWRELEAMINSGVVSWVRNWIWDSTENAGATYGHCWTGTVWSLNGKGWHCRVCGIRSF